MVKPDKARYVWLYLPSQSDKTRWTELAEKANVPLSKFIIEIVENSLAEESDRKPRGEIVKELSRIKEENKRLGDDLRLKNIVLEKYENELKRYRSEAFTSAPIAADTGSQPISGGQAYPGNSSRSCEATSGERPLTSTITSTKKS
ncbi:MAG: hypothetical protein PHY05_10775 [Methanothrix sp.]|nr:hypothetical protein [Methanothrix sp.]